MLLRAVSSPLHLHGKVKTLGWASLSVPCTSSPQNSAPQAGRVRSGRGVTGNSRCAGVSAHQLARPGSFLGTEAPGGVQGARPLPQWGQEGAECAPSISQRPGEQGLPATALPGQDGAGALLRGTEEPTLWPGLWTRSPAGWAAASVPSTMCACSALALPGLLARLAWVALQDTGSERVAGSLAPGVGI